MCLCGVHLGPQKQLHHLPSVATMHLKTEEKIELGLKEQGTDNPAFGVSYRQCGGNETLILIDDVLLEQNFSAVS